MTIQVETSERIYNCTALTEDPESHDTLLICNPRAETARVKVSAVRRIWVSRQQRDYEDKAAMGVATGGYGAASPADVPSEYIPGTRCPACGRRG